MTQLASLMTLLDASMINLALPSIQRSLGASPAELLWVVAGYVLALGLVLVAAGRLGDAFGRRRMFLLALTAFVLASTVGGLAPTAELLVAARVLQGMAAGLLAPQSSGVVNDLFHGAERGRAFGLLGATLGVAGPGGMLLAGLILTVADPADGWRWLFLVNVPIGVVTLTLAARVLPAPPRPAPRLASSGVRLTGWRAGQIDLLGALLLGAAVLALLLPVVQADSGGLRRLWWMFVLVVLLVALFLRWEARIARRGRVPLLDPALLTSTPGYRTGLMVALLYFTGTAGIWVPMSLFLQNGLHLSPLIAGVSVITHGLGALIGSTLGGRLLLRFGRQVTTAGLCAVLTGFLVGAVVVTTVPSAVVNWIMMVPLLVAGIGGGAVISPNMALSLESVPQRMAGAAAGMVQTAQRIGSAVGTAGLAAVFYALLPADELSGYRAALGAVLLCAFAITGVGVLLSLHQARSRPSTSRPREPAGQGGRPSP